MTRSSKPEPPTNSISPTRATSTEASPLEVSSESRQAEEQGERAASSLGNIDSTTSTRTTRSSRSQEATQLRRSARRASIDPYPSQTETMSARTTSSTRTRVPSTQPEHPGSPPATQEEPQEAEMAEGSATGGKDESLTGKQFELVVLQQPEIGAEAGMRRSTLGRLPIVPAPVVQLIIKDETGQILDTEMPYLFCSCSLRDADGTVAVESAPSTADSASQAGEEFSALIGNLVRNPHRIRDLDGNPVSVFVFEDMSVRMQGRFTLEFTLGEARQSQSQKLATLVSEPFDVVEWKNYPGRPAADTVTELSMHLHNQGVPMYIPPLVLSQGPATPPPPSTNPFPADHPDVSRQGDEQQATAEAPSP